MNTQRTPLNLNVNAPLWVVKIGADARPAPATASDHSAILLPDYNLLVDARTPAKQPNWQAACEAARHCNLLGLDGWSAGTVAEQQLLVDRSRGYPAVNKEWLPNTPETGWLWTEEAYAPSPSDYAWCVAFGNGYVGGYGAQHSSGFVRPVRRVSSGQCLDLLALTA